MDPRRRRLLLVGAALAVATLSAALALWLVAGRAPATLEGMPMPAVDAPPPAPERAALRAEAKAIAEASKDEAMAGRAAPMVVERFGARRVSCAGACDREAECGFRTYADCTMASCEGDVRKLASSDFRLAEADTCAAAAAAPCEEACWKRGECTGDHAGDRRCTKACATLVQQEPVETYRESRCVLEQACADLPVCGVREQIRR